MLRFFEDESCGQCTPCRVGCGKAVQLMESEHWDAPLLGELCDTLTDASICGLGQAAPNPIRLVMKHFPEEVGIDVSRSDTPGSTRTETAAGGVGTEKGDRP